MITFHNTTKEIWKDIIGFEGRYQISNFGNVKSLERRVPVKRVPVKHYTTLVKERLLKPTKVTGYWAICLWKNNTEHRWLVHRLVATHFISNPQNKPQVNHIDGNRSNPHISNLEWCTCSENVIHSRDVLGNNLAHWKGKFGKEHHTSIKIICIDQAGVERLFYSQHEAARETGSYVSCINHCLKGRLKTTNKLRFKYAE